MNLLTKFTTLFLFLLILQDGGSVPAIHSTTSHPIFISSSQTIRAEMGDTVRLPCEIKNLGNYIVLWKKDSIVLSAGNLTIVRDDRIRRVDSSIEISRLLPKDAGSYTCEINTDPFMTQTVILDVLEPAKIRRIPEDGKIVARKGDSIIMECISEGNPMPIVSWSRPGDLLPGGEDSVQGPNLYFSSVGRQEAGRYVCVADNGVGEPATSFIDIHVLYPPEIELERSWVHAGVHQEANLTCSVHAEPSASVLWYREDRVIVPSDNRILESTGDKHTLILRNVDESDFGIYACTATNSLGKSSQNLELSGRPSRAVFQSEPPGFSADSYNLTWRVDSFAPIEEYILQYRKLGNESEDNPGWIPVIIRPNQFRSQGRYHKHFYLLERLESGVVYEATIIAKNRYGFAESSETFQFNTLGSEYIPNVKNLEAKEASVGYDGGLNGSNAIRHRFVWSLLIVAVATVL